MRAVNLIPRDARRGGVAPSIGRLGAPHAVIAVLVVVLAFVTVYVLANNSVSSHKAKLASVQQQVTRMRAEVSTLQTYQQFEKLAQARQETVSELASERFDWYGALSDLSKVMPSNTSLQSLVATISPTVSGGGSGGGGNVRGDIDAPAFEIKGCTATQDDVAQFMSRLRLMNGVTRVTLEDSTAPGAGATGTSGAGGTNSCSGPTFDLVVFFAPGSTQVGQSSTTPGAATTGAAK